MKDKKMGDKKISNNYFLVPIFLSRFFFRDSITENFPGHVSPRCHQFGEFKPKTLTHAAPLGLETFGGTGAINMSRLWRSAPEERHVYRSKPKTSKLRRSDINGWPVKPGLAH